MCAAFAHLSGGHLVPKFLEKHLIFTGATTGSLTFRRLVKVHGSCAVIELSICPGYPAQGCFLFRVGVDRWAIGCDDLGWEFHFEVAGATYYNADGE